MRRAFAWLQIRTLLLGALALGLFLSASGQTSTSGWNQMDIGAVSAVGNASESNGAVTVSGSGADIWNSADAFHYFYQQWNGDGIFVVRVAGLTRTDAWAKAGIMLRTGLDAGAAHAFVSVNPDQYASAIRRDAAGNASTITAALDSVDRHMPMWLKLRRDGNQFEFSLSADGKAWHDFAAATLSFPASIYLGLAVTSHSDGTLATATFDNLSFRRLQPGAITAVAHAPTRIDLVWTNEFLTASGWELERSTDNATFAKVWSGSLVNYPYPVQDTNVTPATTYYYRARAITPNGPSEYSPTVSVTTPPASPTGWTTFDIGATALGGSTREASGVFTLTASGAGVGGVRYDHESQYKGDYSIHTAGASDEMQFCGQAWSGDGEMVARLTGVSSDYAQAGIVVRDGTAANAGYVFCGGIGGTGLTMLTRRAGTDPFRDTFAAYNATSGSSRPIWLKLVRQFGGMMGYASSDGVNWQELAWTSNALNTSVHFALTASSRISDQLATATFDNIRIGPVTTPIPPPPPFSNLAVTGVYTNAVQLTWTSGTTYDRIELGYSTDGVNFAAADYGFSATQGSVSGLQSDTAYVFRVRGFRGTQASAYATISARTAPAPLPPTGVTATASSAGTIELRWTDTNAGRAQYYVERTTDNVTWFGWAYDLPGTSYSDTRVSTGTTYYYRMRALIPGAMSGFSNTTSATAGAVSPTGGPTIISNPPNQVTNLNGSAVFTISAAANNPAYQWYHNGLPIAGATSATLSFGLNGRPGAQLSDAGLYTATVTDGTASTSWAGILGFTSNSKVIGSAAEVGPDIVHPNGNVYDQILLQGAAATIRADPGQVARISFVDLTNDIVQVEFGGSGTLTLVLENPTGPATATNYNQPNVSYMRGHASIVIAEADETTNVSVFSVGRANAVNQALFRDDVTYDGMADLACIAILSHNGKFGGIRTANASYVATHGVAGIYAPNITFSGPIYVGDVSAADTAQPTLLFSTDSEVQITGGDLAQTNGAPVQTSGYTRLRFVDGTTSHGKLLPAQPNRARIIDAGGRDITSSVVTAPAP